MRPRRRHRLAGDVPRARSVVSPRTCIRPSASRWLRGSGRAAARSMRGRADWPSSDEFFPRGGASRIPSHAHAQARQDRARPSFLCDCRERSCAAGVPPCKSTAHPFIACGIVHDTMLDTSLCCWRRRASEHVDSTSQDIGWKAGAAPRTPLLVSSPRRSVFHISVVLSPEQTNESYVSHPRAAWSCETCHAIAIGLGLIGLLLPTWVAAIVVLEAKQWFIVAALTVLVFMLCALALAICLGRRGSSQSRAGAPASPNRAAAAAARRTR